MQNLIVHFSLKRILQRMISKNQGVVRVVVLTLIAQMSSHKFLQKPYLYNLQNKMNLQQSTVNNFSRCPSQFLTLKIYHSKSIKTSKTSVLIIKTVILSLVDEIIQKQLLKKNPSILSEQAIQQLMKYKIDLATLLKLRHSQNRFNRKDQIVLLHVLLIH